MVEMNRKNEKSSLDKSIIKKIDALFTSWAKNDSPGCSICVVKDGKPFYLQGYGMANLEYHIPNSSKTIFHIASESKKFTVVAILMLVQQGKLQITDDIHKYLPYVPDFGEKITIKNLIQHTSGIRDQWELCVLGGWRMEDVISQKQIINMVKLQQELNFKPGEEQMYCNTGYTLLAEIVKKISGKTLREFTHEYIFNPLQMFHTHFHDDVEMVVPNRAYSYKIDNLSNQFKKSLLNFDNVGATSLFTTVEDMIKWNQNMNTYEVGGKDLIEQLHEKTVLNNGKELPYAFGMVIDKYRGLKMVGHGGADAGFRTSIARYPEIDMLIVVFCNLGTMSPEKLGEKIMDIFIEEKLIILPKKPSTEDQNDHDQSLKTKFQGKVKEWSDNINGRYELRPGLVVQFQLENNVIEGEVLGDSDIKFHLIQTEPLIFEDLEKEVKVEIKVDDQMMFAGLYRFLGSNKMLLKKIEPIILTESQKMEYTGKYYSQELQIQYPILLNTENKLVVSHHRIKEFELTILQKDIFQGNSVQFHFTRNNEDVITGFQVTSRRVRNLKFVKH